jgi:hypothetical protein
MTCAFAVLSSFAATASPVHQELLAGLGSRHLLQDLQNNQSAPQALQAAKPPPSIPKGGSCNPGFGSGVMGDCADGLKCKFEDPLPYFDAPGVCVDKSPAQKVVGEGGHCGGFIDPAPVCDKGLNCVLDILPDVGGVCKKTSQLIQKGGICGGFVGAQCEPGLTCDYQAIGVGSSAGLCVDGSCRRCAKEKRMSVCGTAPDSQSRTYPSRCYAKCLGATHIRMGSCAK